MTSAEKRGIIQTLRTDYSVRQICETLGFNRSSLYYQPKKDLCETVLQQEIEKLSAFYPRYGYRRITKLLLRMGYTVGYRRVARLMKSANLLVNVKRSCQTTKSVDDKWQWDNQLDNLDICRRNQVWVADVTYVRLKGHFVYVSVLMDVFTRMIRAWQLSRHLTQPHMDQTLHKPITDKLVVLTFDDGCKSQATFVAPILKQYGFGATFYITEGLNFLRNKEAYMTWEEVRGLHEAGFEIGNHTRHHRNVTQQSDQELKDDLQHIDARCEEYAISRPTTFCYPGYSHNEAAVKVVAEHGFHFARRGVAPEFPYDSEGGRGPAYTPTVHHPLLIPTTGASGPNWKFDDFTWALEQATDGNISVLTFHGVPDLEHPWVHTEPKAFEVYMASLAENGYTVIALRDLSSYIN